MAVSTTASGRRLKIIKSKEIMVKKFAISLDLDIAEYVERLAKTERMSRSAFIKRCIMKQLSVESKDYLKMIRGENENN